jgi:hypothetical protein
MLVTALGLLAVSTVSAQDTVPVRLWQDPRPVANRDLRWGSGAQDRAPRPPFAFVEETSGGTQPKIVVKDAAGVIWDVKFGPEAHAAVAANRLVWAAGYFVEEMYFVPGGAITGVSELGRAEKHIGADGAFAGASFRRRDPATPRMEKGWSFNANPFLGSRELSGLKILMTMIGNWDIEGDRNNRILEVATPSGVAERRYFVSDLGATFGRMGARNTNHTKWEVSHYQVEGFIDRVGDDEIELDFDGLEWNMEVVAKDHARWFADIIGGLTEAQVRQAFETSGATPAEVDGFTAVIMKRIAALKDAVATTASR